MGCARANSTCVGVLVKMASAYWAFALLYMTYSICYVSKRSAGYWGPFAVTQDEQFENATASSVGAFSSAFESLGGVSKVSCGFLVDWYSPSSVLTTSVFAVALVHAVLTASRTISTRLWVWAINGFVQAFAWPALAKIFLGWFPDPTTRGKMYAWLATSQNFGAAVTPYLLPPLAAALGWYAYMIVPGVAAVAIALILLLWLTDAPPSTRGSTKGTLQTTAPVAVSLTATFSEVLTSRTLWLLATSYFFNTMVRNAFTEVPDSLLGAGGMAVSQHTRAAALSLYEISAAAGGIAAGYVSDTMFQGRRGPVMTLFSFAAAPLPLVLVFLSSQGGWEGGVVVTYGVLGFTLFAPHMLNGLASREWSDPRMQSTAGGFSKALGQLGGTVAGYPLGLLIDTHGWSYVMTVLSMLCLASAMIMLPLWNTEVWSLPHTPPPTATSTTPLQQLNDDRCATSGTLGSAQDQHDTFTHVAAGAVELRKRGTGKARK